MERKTKIQILEAVKSGLPLKTALRAESISVLFGPFENGCYRTSLEGGEAFSIEETEILRKHFPEILISPITGISYDPE